MRYEAVNRDTGEVVATYETLREAEQHVGRYPNDYIRAANEQSAESSVD
jgi:hypothetical protein